MKRLFFLAVLLGTIILTSVFAFSYWRLRSRTPEAYFEVGKGYYDQGKFSDASNQFLNALKRDANHRDSRFYLALSFIAQSDPLSGFKQLNTLLDAHPDDVEARLKLGSLYISAGTSDPKFYEEAEGAAQTVLRKNPKNVQALILLGNALAGQKKFPESIEVLKSAIALESKNVSAWITLGATRVLEKNLPEAETAFLKAREVGPQDKSALVSLANFYQVAGNPAKAESAFTAALEQFPGDRAVYAEAADFYLKTGRLEEAVRVLKNAQAANSTDPGPTLNLAEIYRQKKREADALALLLDAKTKFPDNIPLATKLAGFLIAQRPDEARREIDQILKANETDPAGLVLLGQLQFARGEFDEAAKTLSKEPAIRSSFPHAHYLLGVMALRNGKSDEAQDHFQQALRLDNSYLPALIALANGFVVRNNVTEAREQVRRILEIDPSNMSGRVMQATLDARENKDAAALAQLSSLLKEAPDNAEIHRQMGLYWVSRNKNVEAEKSLLRAFELEPNEQSLKDLVLLYLATNQIDRAKEKLNAVPETEKKAFHYELAGTTAEKEGKPQEAEAFYKKALEKEPNRLSTENLLFNHYLRLGRLDEAAKQLDDLVKRVTSNATVFAMRASVKEKQGNLKEAEENYRKALEIDPDNDFAANNLAYLLVQEERDLQTAQSLAEGVRRRQPQNPTAADTLAWIYYKQDLPVLAREHAEFAVQKQPDNGVFQYHLGQIYKKSSQIPKAVAALRKATQSSRDFKEKQLALADLQELQKAQTPTKR